MSYVRVWVHLIWSTKSRQSTLEKEFREKLFDHIHENAKMKGIYLDSINGYLDHVHALISLRSDYSISKIVQLLKGESSHWANGLISILSKFEWQDDYIALSVSESAVDAVRRYIGSQEEHHRRKTFAEEYQEFVGESIADDRGLKPAEKGER
ncbi:MAG: IS200/IS605 family transposase [Bacteroidota bacterium]